MAGKSNPMYDLSPPPLQIPEATPVTPRSFQNETQPAPPGGTKAGAIANVAANFLHGMLAAKDVGERKKQETAQFSIQSAWQTYQQLQATASDPSAPEEARKEATANLGNAYQVWLHNVEQYTQPGDKPKKKGVKGVLSRMGGALTAQKPTMGTEDMLALYKSPAMIQMMSQPHGPSPEQQQAQLKLKQEQRADQGAQHLDTLNNQLAEALKYTDTEEGRAKAAQLLQQQQALTGTLKDVKDPRLTELTNRAEQKKAELQSKMSTDVLPLYQKLMTDPNFKPTDAQQQLLSAFGISKGKTDPFDLYMNLAGKSDVSSMSHPNQKIVWSDDPDKQKKQALDLYLSDQVYLAKKEQRPSEYELQSSETKEAIRTTLAATLGRQPTQAEVNQRWLDLTGGTGKILKQSAAANAQKDINSAQKAYDSELDKYNKWKSDHYYRDTVGATNPYEVSLQEKKDELDKAKGKMEENPPGWDDDFNMSPTPSSAPNNNKPSGKERNLSPTPGATKKYRITSGNKTIEEEMTQEEADKMKKANPGWKVEESSGQSLSSPPGNL